MKKLNEDTKDTIFTIGIILLCFFLLAAVAIYGAYNLRRENAKLQKEVDEAPLLEEGVVFSISNLEEGGTIYVLWWESNIEYKLIEVDVDEEIIHTTIEVGDTVLFVVDKRWTDADLLAVVKEIHRDDTDS